MAFRNAARPYQRTQHGFVITTATINLLTRQWCGMHNQVQNKSPLGIKV